MTGTKLWRVLDKGETFFGSELVFPLKKNWKIKPVKVEVT